MPNKIKLSIVRCKECGQRAVLLNNFRVTPSSCSVWEIMETWEIEKKVLLERLILED